MITAALYPIQQSKNTSPIIMYTRKYYHQRTCRCSAEAEIDSAGAYCERSNLLPGLYIMAILFTGCSGCVATQRSACYSTHASHITWFCGDAVIPVLISPLPLLLLLLLLLLTACPVVCIVYYLRRREVMFSRRSVCPCVCLSLCAKYVRNYERILMKLFGGVRYG